MRKRRNLRVALILTRAWTSQQFKSSTHPPTYALVRKDGLVGVIEILESAPDAQSVTIRFRLHKPR